MPEVKEFGSIKVIKAGDTFILSGAEFDDDETES